MPALQLIAFPFAEMTLLLAANAALSSRKEAKHIYFF